MRVLLIDVNCKHSSTGKIVYDIFQGASGRGDTALLCYGRGPFIKEKGIYKFGIDAETYLHAGLARITGHNGCFSWMSTQRLLFAMKKFQPDVIHIHELHAYFVNIKPLLRYIKSTGVKVVWTFHCEYMYTGKCGHANACLNYETECGNCPELHVYPKSLFFDKTNQMFRMKKNLLTTMDLTIVCPSEWLRDRARRSFLKGKRIDVIHNGVDTDIFHPADIGAIKEELGIPSKNKVVLSVGADIMNERKGGGEILKLAERFPKDVIFVLAGAKKSGVMRSGNIMILPTVANQERLAMLYTMADVFLLCSKKETFSMTCAEALCCGTRVVGYQCGAPERIFKEPYAVFVEQGDMDALEMETKKALGKEWKEEREACAMDAWCRYGKEQMTGKYFDLYDEVVG